MRMNGGDSKNENEKENENEWGTKKPVNYDRLLLIQFNSVLRVHGLAASDAAGFHQAVVVTHEELAFDLL